MKLRLTEKQKQAVSTRDCDILVSAAAGSGKTAVLSERILRQLMDTDRPASVTDFLIVTFTNAAAAEMKDRIGKKIMEAAADDSLSPDMRNHLRKQLSLISKASITTIHSFCLDVVKNNFHFIDIDPAVRVADSNEENLLKFQAAEQMLEEMYAGDGKLFSDLCKWLGGGSDETLTVKILGAYRFLSGFPKPIEWLSEKVEEYNPERIDDPFDLRWLKQLLTENREKVVSLIKKTKILLEEAQRDGIFTYEEAFESDIILLTEYMQCFDKGVEGVINRCVEFDSVRRGNFGFDSSITSDLNARRGKIKAAAENICKCFAFSREDVKNQFVKAYPLIKCFEKSISAFERIYKEKKKKAAVIDFGDFEHLALEILSDSENGVADSLKERYREIMIDEYQDCNQTQELIFSYINKKIDGKSSNMFMVGDIKQSIYRFRLADPDIFADKNKNYTPTGMQRKIVLNNNFRSSATILDGINAVFERIMSAEFGGVDYSDEEKLFFRSEEIDKSEDSKCELVIVEDDDNPECDEADYVSERILELVGEGYKFSDISILIRKRNKSAELERALKNRNIPYFSDAGGGYFESLEIGMLTSMLKVIDNPMQDIELVALLRSPVFDFDESLLAKIRLKQKGPFYGALIEFSGGEGEDSEKCREFLNRLSVWRDKVLFMPVDDFIEYLIADTGLDVFAASLVGGEQRSANLKLFVHQARLLQKSGFKGLFAFVNYMERISAGGGDGSEAKMLSENSNVVRILTIHKSKGLEFPVVFVYGCNTKFSKKDTQKEIILHKTEGIGVNFTDISRKIKYPLVSFEVVKNAMLRDNLSEEMRVLYVALTRAKHRLICTATLKDAVKKLENFESLDISEVTCFFEWIAMAKNDENWTCRIISPKDIGKNSFEEEKTNPGLPDEADDEEIDEIFGYVYPYERATTLPTRLSVSEVKRRREYDSPTETKLYISEISETPAFLTDEKISAAEKGIINHLVLSNIDIENPDVDKCVNKLTGKGLLSYEESLFVDKAGIEAFFKSDIGKRLANADKLYRELPFEIDIRASELFPSHGYDNERVMLQGIIDIIFVQGGETIILDYKTDSYLSQESREMYKTQLELYSMAAEKITGKKVDKKYLYMLKKKEFIEV